MNDNGQIIIYQSADGQTHLEVKMENEIVWLTQAQMCKHPFSCGASIS